ncbi:MAG: T9SS type A sorting domain-containing protein [Bacteroidales bacterium]|nr:T9SS type A sorting domain-containing protein [Bacteroidales bacterium]
MKKIFTLMAAFAAFALQSMAQIDVTWYGEKVNDGDVLTAEYGDVNWGTEENPLYDLGYSDSRAAGVLVEPYLTNTSSSSVRVTATLENKDGSRWSVCGLWAQQCEMMTSSRVTRAFTLQAGQKKDSQVHYDGFTQGKAGEGDIDITFMYGAEAISFTLHNVYTPATGIKGVEAQAPAFRLAGRTLHYAFADAAGRTLRVIAADGRVVKSIAAHGQGTLSLANLPAGTYVVAAVKGHAHAQVSKIVVR